MTDDSMRIVLCGCASCPVRDSGFKSYQGPHLCLGPYLILQGCPVRLIACQFRTREHAEQWARDQAGACLH
jgi:hypothetical protein